MKAKSVKERVKEMFGLTQPTSEEPPAKPALPPEQLELDLEAAGMKEPESTEGDQGGGNPYEDLVQAWMETKVKLDRDEAKCFARLQIECMGITRDDARADVLLTIVIRKGLQAFKEDLRHVRNVTEMVFQAKQIVEKQHIDQGTE